jgi:hypothetical protein
VDLDPRAGEDVDEERVRIRSQLDNYKLRPSCVVFSGGGYNALWRLSEPQPIALGSSSADEAVERAMDFERRNWQLELDFSTPDHCRDVCRILRLPGTINRPDAKKVARGREIALSRIVYCDDTSYDYSAFMATPHVAVSKPSSSRVSPDVQRIPGLDALNVPEKIKVIIAQGHDPETPDRWSGDRSSALFYVVCELVRAGVEDRVILGVITDPRFAISASVLDKGSGTTRYAVRQVERARDHAVSPVLDEMNRQFAVILGYGNNTVVMAEQGRINVQTGSYEPAFQTFHAFRNRVKHLPPVKVESGDKVKYVSAFEWWTSHPRRR